MAVQQTGVVTHPNARWKCLKTIWLFLMGESRLGTRGGMTRLFHGTHSVGRARARSAALPALLVEPRDSHQSLQSLDKSKDPAWVPFDLLAEREGFEPPDRRRSTVFKTAAFDHSATSPNTLRARSYDTALRC